MAFCTECGANVPDGIKFCTECGKEMTATAAAPSQQTKPPVQTAAQPKPQTPAYQPAQPIYAAQPAFSNGGGSPPPKESKYAVMGTLAYIGHFLLFAIPIVGLICAVMWAFSGRINQNRRNLARAMLIFSVVAIIAGIFLAISAAAWINSLLEYLREITGEQFGEWQDIFDRFKNIGDQIPSMPAQ